MVRGSAVTRKGFEERVRAYRVTLKAGAARRRDHPREPRYA